jgi:hypothetical protein
MERCCELIVSRLHLSQEIQTKLYINLMEMFLLFKTPVLRNSSKLLAAFLLPLTSECTKQTVDYGVQEHKI